MNSNRMLMGAAIIGCLTAAMTPGAYAQEANTTTQLRANQPATGSMRSNGSSEERRGASLNAQPNVRPNTQMERHATASERRAGASSMREGRGYAEHHAMRGERGSYVGVEGGYRGPRVGYRYRDRAFDAGVGVAAEDSGYRKRRLYAYAPTYAPGYATAPRYTYEPGYDVSVNAAPYSYYSPGWNVAYADPYYGYGPGGGIGIGIGPVGIGIGPAWGW
jgi:hypothetical protein